MRRLFMVLVLLGLTLSVTVGAIYAAPTKNFKGKAVGTSSAAAPTTAVEGALASFVTTSEGGFIGGHLGKGTYTASGQQDWFSTDAGQCEDTVYGKVSGTVTFTRKNGDTLTAEADPDSVVCQVDEDGLIYDSVINYTITGGTGHFASATGSFTSSSTHTRPTTTSGSDDVGSWTGVLKN